MALFGSLDSMPLEELLLVLKSKEGALEIWNVKGLPATTLYLKPGRIRSIDQRGKPLPPEAAKAVLLTLLKAREGSFEFLPNLRPRHRVRLNWPTEKALLSLVTLHDELDSYRDQLPDPQTRFRLQGSPPEDARYRGFLEKAALYLERGATAQELAQALALPLDLVRLYLLKLEHLGALRREAKKGAAPLLFGKGGAA
ncbi:DUF4388 domain-containing protein [Thermus thermophilus]|uniref:PatA-like N-terminal domain-containing protein n=1 Tax=Thermus thermophilus TaxID=274 RepID=A0AAD1KVK1_THETH|nr:DUF4388 domain-containing protein [Thermus thermophilus]BBL82244.1 hypothetical protein TthAA220_10280 [Thermus thermophilus]BBL84547.1 hypothetical protein TthAA229_10280 [Thermus thermophilus]BCZ86897.1 hypothetical protein TthAA11_10790 [Thermus thermophilus]